MCHSFFIHSSVEGHPGCFHVLAIVNNGVHVSFSILVSSGYMPRSGIEIKLPKSVGSSQKKKKQNTREFQKNIYFCFIDYAKAFDCVDHNKLWKILQEMGIPDHLICLLRNLYAGQEATVRTGHGITDWLQIGKGVRQGCILSPCLFN